MKLQRQKNSINSSALSSGYSLLELLISMLIGLFLLTGAYQISLTNSQAKRMQKNAQQIQKNGRFGIDNLTYAIKTAGYSGFYGNLSEGVENLLKTPTKETWDISKHSSGYNNVSSSDNIAGITGFTPDTDVLLLKGMNHNSVSVISNNNPSTIVTEIEGAFSVGDVVVVSDVNQASVFQVNSVNNDTTTSTLGLVIGGNSPGNSTLLFNSFNAEAEIGKYDTQMFYLKDGRNGLPALFKASLINTTGVLKFQENELVSDVMDMQVNFGIDNNNDQILDEYKNASTITDWGQLISVKVVLLAVSSDDNVLPKASSFSFDEKLTTFIKDSATSNNANKRLKRVFRAYIPLRNSHF